MGKLGKKARKFAKKNLQSVHKRKRKMNSMFKKKSSRGNQHEEVENKEDKMKQIDERNLESEVLEEASFEDIFLDECDAVEDDSGSDGYLSEGADCAEVSGDEFESEVKDTDADLGGELSVQNKEIHSELKEKMKKLDKLKKKDAAFSKFLESHEKDLKPQRSDGDFSDEDDMSEDDMEDDGEGDINLSKLLTPSAVDSLCKLVKEQNSTPALISLLNGYRAACHYGTEPSSVLDVDSFGKILMFMLSEADTILKGMLGITSSSKKNIISELKKKPKWKTSKPLIKSFLRSTLFLLNQFSDSEILAFSLVRIRDSVILFAAFPPLLHRLVKILVHLWGTGEGTLASNSFLVIKEVASVFNSGFFETCWIKTYKAFLGHCKLGDSVSSKHLQFLRSSFIDLCTQDMHISSSKAMISIQQLAKIMQLGLRTKNKEAVKKICSWQYVNCIDLWVKLISLNVSDYDLQPLLYTTIQIINGIVLLFPGPRYLPLRRKCIQWLNDLSSSSGVFIPISSFALDILEYKTGKESNKVVKDYNLSSATTIPKHLLKSRNFQQECVSSTVELLAKHFSIWSYHISFPELATIPLVRLRKFHETTTVESFKRLVKRFIDQVEQNVEYVRKKRDDVAYSPKDMETVDSFLQLEKSSSNVSFTQYYKSMIEKAASRNQVTNSKSSNHNQISKAKKRPLSENMVEIPVEKPDIPVENGDVNKKKRRKA